MGRLLRFGLVLAALVGAGLLVIGRGTTSTDTARFVVTDRALGTVGAFGATLESIGAGHGLTLLGGGFEPVIHRTRLVAQRAAPDRIVADPAELTWFGSVREGAFDGAEVDLFRIAGGRLTKVRTARVAQHLASGWLPALPGGRMLAPGTGRAVLALGRAERPGVPLWLALRSVGRDGRVSAVSQPVRIDLPAEIPDGDADLSLTRRPEGAGEDGALPVPAGLTARREGGRVILTWDAVDRGVEILRSEVPPRDHRGFALVLEGRGPAVAAGDLAILRTEIRTPDRARLVANRVWNAREAERTFAQPMIEGWPDAPGRRWQLRGHPEAPPWGGSTYLSVDIEAGSRALIGRYNHSGTGQAFYPVLGNGPVRMRFWVRGEGIAEGRLRFQGPLGEAVAPASFPVHGDWAPVTIEVTPPVSETHRPGRMALIFRGPGRVDIDAVQIHPAGTDFGAPLPETLAALQAAAPGPLRTHAFIKTGRRTYDLEQLTNPAGAIDGVRGGNTLPQTLGLIAAAGADPWLQIEPHFSEAEWLGLAEYLAAPAGAGPWAAKRAAQGRAAPWTEAFDRILIEIGNETWNGLFRPWTFPPLDGDRRYPRGAVYGLYQEHVIGILRTSPHWSAELDAKVTFVLGGWARQGYGLQAARVSPNAELLTIAAYNGGWDVGEGPVAPTRDGFSGVLNQVSQSMLPAARRLSEETAEIGIPLGTYEAGPGYALDGLNGARVSAAEAAAQETVMKSVAAGAATLDSFLAQAAVGFSEQSFFAFGPGIRWSTHAPWHRGGHAHPPWQLLSLFNRVGTGEMLAVETEAVPRATLAARARREAVRDAPLVAAYATRAGDRVTLVVVSRRLPEGDADGHTPVEIVLPFETAERLTLHRLDAPYDAHSVERALPLSETALAPQGGTVLLDGSMGLGPNGLPPGTALVYVFEGVR